MSSQVYIVHVEVISVMPDMEEVYNVIVKLKRSHPGTGLLEVIGPVFCNATRHFLLIQVEDINLRANNLMI